MPPPSVTCWTRGSLHAVGLATDDCRRTHQELLAKGVTFIQEPVDRPYGVEAILRDNSGNCSCWSNPSRTPLQTSTPASEADPRPALLRFDWVGNSGSAGLALRWIPSLRALFVQPVRPFTRRTT